MQGDPGQARRVVLEALQQEAASVTVYKTGLLAALCFTNWIAADLNSLKQTAAQLMKHGHKYDLPESIASAAFLPASSIISATNWIWPSAFWRRLSEAREAAKWSSRLS